MKTSRQLPSQKTFKIRQDIQMIPLEIRKIFEKISFLLSANYDELNGASK